MADRDDKDPLAREYERNTLLEHICAGVLVVGLAAELVNASIWFEGTKTIAEMFAVSLIVLGVAGEVWFGNRARIAGDKQMVQDRARAAEAALELARFRAPRDLSREQMARMANKLSEYSASEFIAGRNPGDPEFEHLLRDIEVVLEMAGWKQVSWNISSGITRGMLPTIGTDTTAESVEIGIPINNREAYEKPAHALVVALNAEGIAARVIAVFNRNAFAITVVVGPKR